MALWQKNSCPGFEQELGWPIMCQHTSLESRGFCDKRYKCYINKLKRNVHMRVSKAFSHPHLPHSPPSLTRFSSWPCSFPVLELRWKKRITNDRAQPSKIATSAESMCIIAFLSCMVYLIINIGATHAYFRYEFPRHLNKCIWLSHPSLFEPYGNLPWNPGALFRLPA